MLNKKSNNSLDYSFYILLFVIFILVIGVLFFTLSPRIGHSYEKLYSQSIIDTLFYNNCFGDKFGHIYEEKFTKQNLRLCVKKYFIELENSIEEKSREDGRILKLEILDDKYSSISKKEFISDSNLIKIDEGRFENIYENYCFKNSKNCFNLNFPIIYITKEGEYKNYFLNYVLILM